MIPRRPFWPQLVPFALADLAELLRPCHTAGALVVA